MQYKKLVMSKAYKRLVVVICLMLSLCSCMEQVKPEEISSSNDVYIESSSIVVQDETEDFDNSIQDSETKHEVLESVEDEESSEESAAENTDFADEIWVQPVLSDPQWEGFDISLVQEYSENAYTAVNDNLPYFMIPEGEIKSFEFYSDLDYLGRCGVTYACIGKDIMPTEERGSIGQVKPTGWETIKYEVVDGNYLYNRCHLIGYQLTAENANTSNLITGTRYLNVEGMLPFGNMVADYITETENHVMYRVTPIFEGNNLLASGVLMEGYSIEDEGEGICFNVFCYNVQPGIAIDYATGASSLIDFDDELQEESITEEDDESNENEVIIDETEDTGTTYMCNTNTKKFHFLSCSSVDQMADKNKKEFTGDRQELIDSGYEPCKRCNP